MGDSSISTSGSKKKKKGVFKSIVKGISLKKKKKRPDDDSVVGVALDRSAGAVGTSAAVVRAAPTRNVSFSDEPKTVAGGGGSSSATNTSPAAKPIRVILLLMDPSSRRFELLQLEFDSNKAMVNDVLRQIQSSATEKTLRDVAYAGVCDHTGMEMISTMKLSKFCKGNDVVMAIPCGMTGKGTAKLAGPILGDPKVKDMLAPCGVSIQTHIIKRSRSASSSETKLKKIAEENTCRQGNKPTLSLSQRATKSGGGKLRQQKLTSILPSVILGIIILSLLFFTVKRHIGVTKLLESGDVILPGQWKSQCGVFDLFPVEWLAKLPFDKLSPSCDTSSSSMLELGRDGTLRYFTKGSIDDERKEVWSVAGIGMVQCPEGGEEHCFDKGATFVKDESYWYVDMGGARTTLNNDVIRDFTAEN